MKNKNKHKNQSEANTKMKIKTKAKMKMKTKTKMKIKMNFRFCFHFVFLFCFYFLKVFCIFVNSAWPRGAIGGQLSLDWPRSVIAFLLTPRGLEVPRRSTISYLAQKCHSIFVCKFSTWPRSGIDGQLSLDWPRSDIAPKILAPSLIRICRIH